MRLSEFKKGDKIHIRNLEDIPGDIDVYFHSEPWTYIRRYNDNKFQHGLESNGESKLRVNYIDREHSDIWGYWEGCPEEVEESPDYFEKMKEEFFLRCRKELDELFIKTHYTLMSDPVENGSKGDTFARRCSSSYRMKRVFLLLLEYDDETLRPHQVFESEEKACEFGDKYNRKYEIIPISYWYEKV